MSKLEIRTKYLLPEDRDISKRPLDSRIKKERVKRKSRYGKLGRKITLVEVDEDKIRKSLDAAINEFFPELNVRSKKITPVKK